MDGDLRTGVVAIVALLGALAAPSTSAAAEPPAPRVQAPEEALLDCDTSVLEADPAARIDALLRGELESVIAESPGLGVAVRIVGFDEERRDYEVAIELRDGDGDGAVVAAELRCEACSERRLVATVGERVRELRAGLTRDEGPQEPAAGVVEAAPAVVPVASEGRRLTGRGIAGAVVLGLGVAATGVGAGLLGVGTIETSRTRNLGTPFWKIEYRDLRPSGVATLATGAVAAVVGGGLLTSDRLRHKRQHGSFGLRLAPSFFGLQFRRRF